MKNRVVKLSDVARAADVDASTVSRVLNDDPRCRVGEATRKRIFAAARDLGYRPNVIARGLRTARTHTLGFAVPQLDDPVFTQIVIGATAAAHARGYHLVLAPFPDVTAGSQVYERLSGTHRVDGLLVGTLEEDAVLRKGLEGTTTPYVVVNRKIAGIENCVAFDDFAAAREATNYLLSLGHRRIAHVTGNLNGSTGALRLAGYKAALESAGIKPDARYVAEAGYNVAGGARAAGAVLAVKPRPTAILAATILSASGVLKVLHAAGVRIPADVSVMSIHDIEIVEMLHPPLTTIRMPLRRLGELAADGLIDLIENKTDVVAHTLSPDGLHVRESTARPANGR